MHIFENFTLYIKYNTYYLNYLISSITKFSYQKSAQNSIDLVL